MPLFFAVCLNAFAFEFRPRTFTIDMSSLLIRRLFLLLQIMMSALGERMIAMSTPFAETRLDHIDASAANNLSVTAKTALISMSVKLAAMIAMPTKHVSMCTGPSSVCVSMDTLEMGRAV